MNDFVEIPNLLLLKAEVDALFDNLRYESGLDLTWQNKESFKKDIINQILERKKREYIERLCPAKPLEWSL